MRIQSLNTTTPSRKYLFEYIREDHCPYCNRDRSLELYDESNDPINFSFLLDRESLSRILECKKIYYGKCTYCNKIFDLDWSRENRIPVPLTSSKIQNYIKQYSKSKVV